MKNDKRNLKQHFASSNAVTETQVQEATPVTPETHLPRGIMILSSLSNSLYKAGLGLLYITLAGVLGVVTYLWVKGIVSTYSYIKMVQALIELMQNFILV